MSTSIILCIVFSILGAVFLSGKGAGLIAGYNMKSDEEKAAFNEKALCQTMAVVCFGVALSFIVDMVGYWTNQVIWHHMSTAFVIIIVIFGIIYMNTSKKIKHS